MGGQQRGGPDDGDAPENRARRRLLKIAVYTPPVVLGTIAVTLDSGCQAASCNPAQCNPSGGPCGPSQCSPNGGPCGPDACNPNGNCGPDFCNPNNP